MKTSIGGDRLGSGNKQEVSLKNFGRSTHDLSYIWRSSMSSGTLVPFMSELGLPGDSFDIDLNCDVKTLPTIGPLFGSYKVQLDVFEVPIRLYNAKLHMNMLGIGMEMENIKLPQMELKTKYDSKDLSDNKQINPSAIFSYLNIRGLGRAKSGTSEVISREFNAVPYLAYWDIFKQYYSNKMEKNAYVIHQEDYSNEFKVCKTTLDVVGVNDVYEYNLTVGQGNTVNTAWQNGEPPIVTLTVEVAWENAGQMYGSPDKWALQLVSGQDVIYAYQNFSQAEVVQGIVNCNGQKRNGYIITYTGFNTGYGATYNFGVISTTVDNTEAEGTGHPQLKSFALDNIDQMREDILSAVGQVSAFKIDRNTIAPYGLALKNVENNDTDWDKGCMTCSQEGLAIKTYQSDLFNNFLDSKWIEGQGSINDITAVDTSSGSFSIDALNLANKVYNMLNRIAVSGGTYDDWLDAVYTHERVKSVENPVYHGSLIKELSFEEVISQADTDLNRNGETVNQPLGTLAGRGRLTGKHKGGKMKIKCNEPCYVMGIVSLTPRVDYSQGNKWDTSLKNLAQFHAPSLDAIGWQDLTTDGMNFYDTEIDTQSTPPMAVEYSSVGKQPAWIEYMTNVNQTRGNFADESEMFMTLNRRYEVDNSNGITDLTTYVDPSKFNNIFAQESLDSQNFWVQIGLDIKARRKMSAKVIPNL